MADFNDGHQDLFEEGMKHFQKAFNAGYQLSKHEPQLMKQILQSPNQENSYLNAMKAGNKQYEKDKFIDQIKQTQEKSKDKEKEI